jgi:hypothetical protein
MFPFRAARRSVTGRASSSEGGSGTPGLAQPASSAANSEQNHSLNRPQPIQCMKRVSEGALSLYDTTGIAHLPRSAQVAEFSWQNERGW